MVAGLHERVAERGDDSGDRRRVRRFDVAGVQRTGQPVDRRVARPRPRLRRHDRSARQQPERVARDIRRRERHRHGHRAGQLALLGRRDRLRARELGRNGDRRRRRVRRHRASTPPTQAGVQVRIGYGGPIDGFTDFEDVVASGSPDEPGERGGRGVDVVHLGNDRPPEGREVDPADRGRRPGGEPGTDWSC